MSKWFSITVMIFILSPLLLSSQTFVNSTLQPQKKIALVIGNGTYRTNELANPENDAKAMKSVLQSVGFTVQEYENLNQIQIKKAIDDFGERLKNFEVGLFFYAGHGIQAKGYNYLIPVDAQIQSEQQVEYDCVRADRVLALMEASGTKVNVIILDACRNNPFERSWSRSATSSGLAYMSAPKGTLIAYATAPGSTASDGSGKNGLYTAAILESIKIKNITIIQMFQNVRNIVAQKSDNKQMPWESTSLTGDFYFNTGTDVVSENTEKIRKTPDEKPFIIDSGNGKSLKAVKVGTQLWMAENLNTGKFNDGTDIPLVQDNSSWSNLTAPGYCLYNNDGSAGKLCGALYNWYTVNTGKLCPTGWHVPTDAEWTELTTYLGGESAAGGKLKESGTDNWDSPNFGGTDETGFSALPGGYRYFNGEFFSKGSNGFWWSASENFSKSAWVRGLFFNNREVGNLSFSKSNGYSVRCLRDL